MENLNEIMNHLIKVINLVKELRTNLKIDNNSTKVEDNFKFVEDNLDHDNSIDLEKSIDVEKYINNDSILEDSNNTLIEKIEYEDQSKSIDNDKSILDQSKSIIGYCKSKDNDKTLLNQNKTFSISFDITKSIENNNLIYNQSNELNNESQINEDNQDKNDKINEDVNNTVDNLKNSGNNLKTASIKSRSDKKSLFKKSVINYKGFIQDKLIQNKSESSDKLNHSFNLKTNIDFKSQKIDDLFPDNDDIDQLKHELNIGTVGAILLLNKEEIIQYNNQISDKLFYGNIELIATKIHSLLPQEQQLILLEKLENMNITNNNSGDFSLKFQDKNHKIIEMDVKLIRREINFDDLILVQIQIPSAINLIIIDPKSQQYVVWVLFISVIMLGLLVQLPYEMSFSNNSILEIFEIQMTLIFFIDIVFNFNLAYYEDGILIKDRQAIITNYLSGWFIIDFISIVPLNFLFNISFNTQLLKSIKLFKLLRIIKVLKQVKLTKIASLIFYKDENLKQIYKIFKSNRGQLDIMKNMLFILIFAHQQTIIQQQLSVNHFCKNGQPCWINDHLTEERLRLNNDYLFLLQLKIKISLGLDSIIVYNLNELIIAIVWCFFGLSLFGYGIGNISSFLTQSNKQDQEYAMATNQFNDFFILQNIDPRLQNLVNENLDGFQSKFADRELDYFSKALVPYVKDQIENSIQHHFMRQIKLFEKLNVQSLKLIKEISNLDNQKIILRKDLIVQNIQFIKKGKVDLYDNEMNIINYQEKDEILGMEYFQAFFQNKQSVDLEKIVDEHIEEVQNKVKNQLTNILGKKLKISFKPSRSSVYNSTIDKTDYIINRKSDNKSLVNKFIKEFEDQGYEFKQRIQNEETQFLSNYSAICNDEIEYIEFSFNSLEQIIFNDMDSFLQIQKQDKLQNREISAKEKLLSEEFLFKFQHSLNPMILVQPDGRVFDCNDALKKEFESEDKLFGIIFDQIFQFSDEDQSIIEKIEHGFGGLHNDEVYQFKNGNLTKQVKIDLQKNIKILNQDHNSRSKIVYYNYAKCLVQVNAITLEFIQ